MNIENKSASRQLRILIYIDKVLILINLLCIIYMVSPSSFNFNPPFYTLIAFLILILLIFLANSRYWQRVALGVQTILFALANIVFLLITFTLDDRLGVCLAFAILSAAFTYVGYLLLASKSIRDAEHL